MLNRLNDTQKGALSIVAGFILLFNTIGLFGKSLNILVILASIGLIVYGVILGDFYAKLTAQFKKSE